MAALEQQQAEFVKALEYALEIVKGAFPIEGRQYKVVGDNFHWDKVGHNRFSDLTAQKDAKQKEKSFVGILRGDLALVDSHQKVIEVRRNAALMEFPHLTRTGGYIVNGQERQIVKQMRLRPGMYGGYDPNNNSKVFINTSAAGTYKVILKSDTGNCYLSIGLTNLPIYSVLRSMGAVDSEIRAAMGPDIFEVNRKIAKLKEDTVKLYKKLRPFNKLPDDMVAARQEIVDFLGSKPLDPAVNKVTLGNSSDKIDKAALMAAVKRCIALSKKTAEPDDMESLAFKQIMGLEDFIKERLEKGLRGAQGSIKRVLNKSVKSGKIPELVEVVPPSVFSRPVESFFTTSDMSRFSDQNNPVDILGTNSLITPMGEGGIGSTHAVRDEVRMFHPTHMGVLGAIAGVEGSSTGLTNYLTADVRKKGHNFYIPVYSTKTGKRQYVEVGASTKKTIAFPDQYSNIPKDGKGDIGAAPKAKTTTVKARRGEDLAEVKVSDVDYFFASSAGFFSPATLMIPFVPNNHSNRVLMGGKHISQTVPLVHADQPLVQHEAGGESIDKTIGDKLLAHAPIAGQVTRITKDSIRIRPKSGRPVNIPIYNKYHLNSKTFLTYTVIVKVGDTVAKGQRLTDNTFTKDGVLAMGKNLKIGYFAASGDTFEDAVLISASAAKKLTSVHKEELKVEKSKGVSIGKSAHNAAFPTSLESTGVEFFGPLDDYDSDGIIRKGAIVKPNQIVIPAVRKVAFHPELDLAKLKKSIGARWTDISEIWDHSKPGKVIDVVTTGKFIKVYVEYTAPMQISDKLSIRHGAKGTVSTILPDSQMYQDEKGDPLDIVVNTAAVPGRVNPGQMLEAAAGKIAEKTGKPYYVRNFDSGEESMLAKVQADLKKHGLKDSETVTDPRTGNKIKGALVGTSHIIKLLHTAEKKISGRNTLSDSYSTAQQPSKGGKASAQRIGALDTYSLLSGDATAFLHDAFGIKSQRNDDYWMALQAGKVPPPPKTPFVADKFIAMLIAAGMDLKQEGNDIQATPLTDSEVLRMSHGEITNPTAFQGNSLRPERGGLFDKALTGGPGSEASRWNHIELASPVVNPLLITAAASVGKFKTRVELTRVVNGERSVTESGEVVAKGKGKYTGAEGVAHILSKLDVDKEIKVAKAEAKIRRGAARDKAFRRLRYLKNLKEMGMRPEEAYIQHVIPVLPTKFRQVTAMDDGTLAVADSNHNYREVLLINEQIKKLRAQGIDEEHIQPLLAELNTAVGGVSGINDPVTRGQNFQGMVGQIKGRSSAKTGFFQQKVSGRPQDLSGRAVITPNPKMHMDEIGVPRQMAKKLYRPFVIRRLTTMGYSPKVAKDLLDNGDPVADKAMEVELQHRPVYANRAPSLHKFNILAFKPRLINNQAIEANPLIVSGMNADFDGDLELNRVYFRIKNGSEDTVRDELLKNTGFPLFEGINIDYTSESKAKAAYQTYLNNHMCSRTQLPVAYRQDGTVYCVDLADFPHCPEPVDVSMGSQGNLIRWHNVPEGIEVLAYDEETNSLKWTPATMHTVHVDCPVEIVSLSHGGTLYTDDDPRAVYGISAHSTDMGPTRFRPADALTNHVSVPYATEFNLPEDGTHFEFFSEKLSGNTPKVGPVELTPTLGYTFGALCGDGWGANRYGAPNSVCLSGIQEDVIEATDKGIQELFVEPIHRGSREGATTGENASYGESRTAVWSSSYLSARVQELIGHGAANKHLPPFAFNMPRASKLAMLAGLIDTDGTVSVCKAKAKKKPQTVVAYYSNSLRLLREIQLLARAVGIKSGISETKTPGGNTSWIINLKPQQVKNSGVGKYLKVEYKRDTLANVPDEVISPVAARYDAVPMPRAIAHELRTYIKALPKARAKVGAANQTEQERQQASIYAIISKQAGRRNSNNVCRSIARRIITMLRASDARMSSALQTWVGIVEDTSISWGTVTDVQVCETRETGYDLSVPGYETFTCIDGIVVSNTMGLHLPVSEEARKEALEKMLPSKHLFAVGNDSVMHIPTKESVHGVYLMTKPLKGVAKPFPNGAAVLKAYHDKAIKVNTPVKVNNAVRCAGQFMVAAVLPPSAEYKGGIIDKGELMRIIESVSKVENSTKAADIITQLKDLGNHYVGEIGWAVSLKDLTIDTKKRDAIINKIKPRAAKVGFEQAATEATQQLTLLVAAAADKNAFADAALGSKAMGKAGQLAQMIASPVAFTDYKNRVVPIVMKKSFAEGHDLASYLNTIPGARKGLIDKGLSVADTGYESRLIVNSTIETRITMQDCGTTVGEVMPLSGKECLHRYIANGANKGRVLDDRLRRELLTKQKTIEVRSPLHCLAQSGICAKCFGEKAGGGLYRTGFHIGALAGQTLGEQGTQTTLSSFHTGGSIGGASMGFNRIKEVLELPQNVKGSATLAETDGVITRIDAAPAGGQYIYVGQTKHFVPAGQRDPKIRMGRKVKAGDALSLGVIKPQELLQQTGDMHRVQKYMVDELHDLYGGKIQRRLFETAVKPLTDRAKITNPGDATMKFGMTVGDVVPMNVIEARNKELKAMHLKPMQYEPMIFGIKKAPMYSEDFIGRLSHQELKKTLQEAPALGLRSKLVGGHPITELALHGFKSIRNIKGR